MRLKLFLIGMVLTLFFASCGKDEDITMEMNAKLNFSVDSVFFDTVFTSIGSTSRRLKIINPNEKAININQIKLFGGNSSAFSLNINGLATTETAELKVNGKDSINIFVKVNINPTNENLPFIVQDSILFFFNGKKQNIPLVAYGQNAVFVNSSTITKNTTWDSKLPYLIYKSVTVPKDVKLTIEPGTKVLFHNNATMSIKGTLAAIGTKKDSIIFASDRLEKIYEDETGQWNGIHFYADSKDSNINYAVIKNGIAGITSDSLSSNKNPKLLLTNSIIKNMEVVGFLGYQTELTAFNNLLYNCGQYLLYGAGGGKYNLKQNTFAGYNINFARKTPAVYLSDYISNTQSDNLNIELYNNIIWGKLAEEFLIDKKASSTTLSAMIKNNLLKSAKSDYNNNGNILNVDPQFLDTDLYNFKLSKSSTANHKGLNLTQDDYFDAYLKRDLNNKTRSFPSTIGCYE